MAVNETLGSGINDSYPVAGQDNDTQGFRDNFSTIKNSLSLAGGEISDLNSNAVQSGKENNLGGNEFVIADGSLVNITYRARRNAGDSTVDANLQYNTNGDFLYYKITGNQTFVINGIPSFNDPSFDIHGQIKLLVYNSSDASKTVSFSQGDADVILTDSTLNGMTDTLDSESGAIYEIDFISGTDILAVLRKVSALEVTIGNV